MTGSLPDHNRGGGHATTRALHQQGATAGRRQPGPVDDHAVSGQPGGRQAGGLRKRQGRRLGHEVAPRHRHDLGQGPRIQLREKRTPRVKRLVAAARGRVTDDRVDDHIFTVRAHSGRVTAQNHRQPVRGQPYAAQAEQVVMVERRGPDSHRGPAVRDGRFRALAHGQPGQRVD